MISNSLSDPSMTMVIKTAKNSTIEIKAIIQFYVKDMAARKMLYSIDENMWTIRDLQ